MPTFATKKKTIKNPRAKGQKKERLEARMTHEQKVLMSRAAAIQGRTLTEFVVTCAQEEAHRTIREHETMTLGEKDRRVFVEALLSDTEPNDKLKQAAERYLERW